MKKALLYGMVGGGPDAFIGQAHRRAIALDRSAALAAGCFSRTEEKNKQTAAELGVAADRCYSSYQEMADAESARPDGIRFVVVVTPNHSHYEICRAFLRAGIHVVCDKPLAVSYAQALELQKLADEKDLLFMVTYTYTGYVMVKHVRELIRRGDIGQVRMVMAEFPQGWLARQDDWGGKQGAWRCDPAQSGGVNCLGDLGTHVENMVYTMTGLKIRRVLAKLDVVVPGRVLDDNDCVLVEYENGASGIYWSSQIAMGHDNSLRVRIYGSRGSVFWSQETPEKLTVADESGQLRDIHRGHPAVLSDAAWYARLPSGHPEGWFEAMGNLYRSFTACIRAKDNGTFAPEMIDYPTAAEGAEGLAFVEACLRSSQSGNIWAEL